MAVGQTEGSRGGGLSQSFVTALTAVHSFDAEGIGKIRHEDGKWYKWVKYDEGTDNLDVLAGDFLVYKAATGYKNSLVVPDASDGDATTPFGAGVAGAVVDTDGDFFWIQIKGFVTLSLDPTGTPGDSNALVPSSTNKAMAIATSSDVEHICGHTLDDTAKEVYLDCPW